MMTAGNDDDFLGKLASDIPADKLEELIRRGYSVSPQSGRLRKRVRKEKEKKKFSKKKLNKIARKAGWIFLLLLFLLSIVMIIPNLVSKKDDSRGSQKTR